MDENNKPIINVVLVNFGRVNKVGIFTLAGYCRSKNLTVKIIDGSHDSIVSQFKELNRDYKIISAGFTSTTDVIGPVTRLAAEFKKINPGTFLILGGYHSTILPEEILASSDFDIAVVREGEITLSEILKKLKQGTYPTAESGCYEKANGQIIFNGYRPLIDNLDDLPYPAYDLVDIKKYFHGIRLETDLKKVLVLLISRGCPFDCVFCGSKNMWCRKFRMHSVDYVINIIKWLIREYEIEGISFLDDELVTNKKYINELCDRFISEGINKKIKWSCHARVSSVDEETLKKMKKAGCILVRFGIESGSENMLAYLKNNSVKISQAYQALALCKKVGLPSFGSFIIGSPDETIDDIVQTIEFIEQSGLAYVDVFSMVPYPGTDIYELAKKNNLIKPDITWDDFRIEGENTRSILRSRNFDFDQIDHLKSYINLNVVYPLNHKLPNRKLDHKKELEKVLAGDLSRTEFSGSGKRKMRLMKLADKIKRAIGNPLSIISYLKPRVVNNYPILLILLLAFVLRIWGVAYGLPGLFVGDEKSIVGGALKMMYEKNIFPVLDPNTFRLLYYPVLIPWILLIFFVPYAILVYLTGNFSSLNVLRDYFTLNPENFFLIARVVNVFFAVAVVFLIYKVAKEIFSKRVGLFAALLYAISWLPIHQGHFVKHWNVGAVFGLLALYLAFLILKSPNKKKYILAGVMAGLAGFTDYIFAIYGIFVVVIHFGFLKSSWRKKITSKKFWSFAILLVLIFVLGVLAYPQEFWRMAFGEDSTATAAKSLAGFWQVIKEIFSTFYHLETLVFILSLIGGLILFFKNKKLLFLMIFIPIISPFLYYFFLHFEARYILLFFPFLVILAGYGLDKMFELLKINKLLIFFASLLIVAMPLKNAVIFDMILSQKDTRILANEWVRENLPYGAKLIINSWEFNLPKNVECLYQQQQFRNLSLRSQDYVMWNMASKESYCVWPVDLILALPPNVAEYEYYIIDSYTARQSEYLGDELMSRADLIKEFKGSPYVIVETWPDNFVFEILQKRRVGPDVKVYKLKPVK